MTMNETPSGERIHIGFFGRRNAGKSSLVNAITGQSLSVVSKRKGTTTDPVRKSMELLPLGPVVLIDTPGYDDEGSLGRLRVEKTLQILGESDGAVLVADASYGLLEEDRDLIRIFQERELPYLIVMNKEDQLSSLPDPAEKDTIYVSASCGTHIRELKERMAVKFAKKGESRKLVSDFLSGGELVVLVIPIDKAAPKGRLILPQQQAIRDILDAGAFPLCVRDRELPALLKELARDPDLVITDSQVFDQVAAIVPDRVLLTSFSILMARYKGFLDTAIPGAYAIDGLKKGDRVLISEGCTHHRQCDDIGTVKLPRLLKKHTGQDLIIETSSGRDFPADLSPYRLVIHCGGCMLNEREMVRRMEEAKRQQVPFTNYGTAIAHMRGILERSTEIVKR